MLSNNKSSLEEWVKILLGIFVVLIFVLSTVTSCNQSNNSNLVSIDSLGIEHPEKAAQLLDSVLKEKDSDNISISFRMYSLLIKESLKDKLYYAHNLDTIQKLVDYYEDTKDKGRLPRAYYLLGRTLYDLHDSPQALFYYHKVLKCLHDTPNIHLLSMTNSQIGYIFYYQGDFKKALNYYEESFKTDSELRDTLGCIYDLRDIAICQDNLKLTKESKKNFYKALALSSSFHMRKMENSIKLQLAYYYLYESENLDSVRLYASQLKEQTDPSSKGSLYNLLSDYYLTINNLDSAKHYLLKMTKEGDSYSQEEGYRKLVPLSLDENNCVNAKNYYNNFLQLSDSNNQITTTNSIEHQQNLYDYTLREQENLALKISNKNRLIIICTCILFVVVILLAFFIYFHYSKMEKIRLIERIREIQHNYNNSKVNKGIILNNRSSLESAKLISQKLNTRAILHEDDWDVIERDVLSRISPSFKNNLFSLRKISEHEYHICLLIKLNYSPSEIAILTSRTKQSIAMTRSRLYKKLSGEKGKPEDLDALVKIM